MSLYLIAGPARRDLAQIWDYYQRTANESVADLQIDRLYASIGLLAEYPNMGVPRAEYAPRIRSHPALNTPYIILYYPWKGEIEVSRVVHASQDIARLFDQPA